MGKPGKKASRLRQQVREIERQRARWLDVIVKERGPMIRGTYTVQGRRCGNENCKCTRGELHPIVMLSASVEGRTKNLYVRTADR